MNLPTYGYGVDTDVIGSASVYGFGVRILVPFFQKVRAFALKITRIEHRTVKK